MPSPIRRTKSTSLSSRVASRRPSRMDDTTAIDPMPTRVTPGSLTPEEQNELLGGPMPSRIDGTWPISNVSTLTHSRSGSHLQMLTSSETRVFPNLPTLMTSMSSMPSLRQTETRSGGLKATIKRMFGSKRHRAAEIEVRKENHMSDPGGLTTTSVPRNQSVSTQKSSRPPTAMQRSALGSHAPTPSSETNDFDPPGTHGSPPEFPRRNTLPTLTVSDHETQSFSKRMGTLMSNSVEQLPKAKAAKGDRNKRRSQSVEALSDKFVADEKSDAKRQDRDAEITFWRNSLLLNPLPSRSTSRPSTHLSSQGSRNNIKVRETPSLEHILKPAQSFDFGLGGTDHEPMDLEERVNTLEVKMFDFEYAIAKLQGVELPKPTLPTRRMKRKNIQEVYAKPSIRSLSTTTSAYDRPPITPGDSPIMYTSKEPFATDRNSKATTIRPMIRNDSPIRSSLRMTAEQYDALLAMIQNEKDARQLMEMQILDLQKEIELLQTPVYATINYPAPNSDFARAVSTQKKLHRSPPFSFNRPPACESSRFSMTESEAESTDDNFGDIFQTPRQQNFEFESSNRSPVANTAS